MSEQDKRIEALEEKLEQVINVITGYIMGLHDVIVVKAASEDEDAQASFVEVLENAFRNNIHESHLEEYQDAFKDIFGGMLSTIRSMSADLQLRIYSPPPYDQDDRDNKRSTLESSDS